MIGDRIRKARYLLGWSQTELGQVVGLGQVAVSNAERGATKRGRILLYALYHCLSTAGIERRLIEGATFRSGKSTLQKHEPMTRGELIELRRQMGLSQPKAAGLIFLNVETLRRYEQGRSPIPMVVALAIRGQHGQIVR